MESNGFKRVLGRLRGAEPGPTIVAMTGIHGNEVSGVRAAERVLQGLQQRQPTISGEMVFLAGNLTALARHSRFIDLDLNRQWTPDRVAHLVNSNNDPGEPVENSEQRALLALLREIIEVARGPLFFLDLHTSSADGPPFVTIGDTLRNRRFAHKFPLPLILGLEEQVDGALLELMNNHGFVTMGVEGGHHEAGTSVDRHEAVLWLGLVHGGVLRAADVPDLTAHVALLREASRDIPSVVEVRHRHAIRPEQRFRMKPGYYNFKPVIKGEQLGEDRNGEVLASEDGLILLPLYQGQGDDGFFVSRPVRPFWLKVSFLVRHMQLGGLMRFLPGVRPDPDNPEVLLVDTRVARIYPLEVFHVFGFRKVRQSGSDLIVSRRRYDLQPPTQISFC
jgi:succinylglutamate desuccinylase